MGKTGLLGGTFNPIHCGHIQAAKIAAGRFKLDKILFIPAYIPPHKEKGPVAEAEHRWEMVKYAAAPYPRFIPSSIEMEAEGPSYSINTIREVKRVYPGVQLYFILGVDAFLEIDTWKDHRSVLESCRFIVISRPGYDLLKAFGILGGRYKEKMTYIEEKDKIDLKMLERYHIYLFKMNSLDVSSSEIRQRIKQGRSIKGMVPLEVEKYIKEKDLYS